MTSFGNQIHRFADGGQRRLDFVAEHRDEIRPLALLFREPGGHILESAPKFSKSLEKLRKAKN
jgi:hypothetical protein